MIEPCSHFEMRLQVYRREVRDYVDDPTLTKANVMTMKEAQQYLSHKLKPYGKKVSISNIRGYLDRGTLTTIVNGETLTLKGTPKRYLLKTDVEALAVRLIEKEEGSDED